MKYICQHPDQRLFCIQDSSAFVYPQEFTLQVCEGCYKLWWIVTATAWYDQECIDEVLTEMQKGTYIREPYKPLWTSHGRNPHKRMMSQLDRGWAAKKLGRVFTRGVQGHDGIWCDKCGELEGVNHLEKNDGIMKLCRDCLMEFMFS